MTSTLRWRFFVLAAIAINLIAFGVVRLVPRPAVGVGAALDVAVTVPALYFFLIVRGGLQPLISLAPLVFVGLVRATYLAPGIVWTRPAVAAVAELAVFALIAARLRRGWRAAETACDVVDGIEIAARKIMPSRRLAAVLAGEIAVLYFALASWRQAPDIPENSRAFTIHQQSGVAALFGMLAGVSLIEAGLVHLVVMRWSVLAAWVLTALSVYGMIWLTAMARAFILRPVLVTPGELVARSGILWTVHIPLDTISAIEASGVYDLKLPLAASPNVVLHLSRPVTARGLYGMTRRISSLGLAVDDRTGFKQALPHEN